MHEPTTEAPIPPSAFEIPNIEPMPNPEGLGYLIEQPERLWELVGNGTKAMDSAKSGALLFVVLN
jgi:hypothetical protein